MENLTKAKRRKLKKLKRKEEKERERHEILKARRRKKLLVYSLVVLLLIASIYFFSWRSKLPGKHDDFAKCLTEKGFVMAGTDWCDYCKKQKSLFGKSFEFVNYKNCDLKKKWCYSKGVEKYPTWIFPDGTMRTGVQELSVLSQESGCDLK